MVIPLLLRQGLLQRQALIVRKVIQTINTKVTTMCSFKTSGMCGGPNDGTLMTVISNMKSGIIVI